ncbi:hypothetical protein Tco_0250892 [Tanacetum coccineum]
MTTKTKPLPLDQTKGRTRKDTQSLKKLSASKESSKGNTPLKSSKSSKSVTTKEPKNDEFCIDIIIDCLRKNDDEMGNANRLKLDKITKADLVGPVYNLLKGTCQISIDLEYDMEECCKALTDKLDWENPKGDRCLFDLSKPLPLKGRLGHLTIASEYFFNNDMEYLKSTDSERKYTTSITKAKATRFLKHDVYSHLKILSVVSVKVDKLHGYGYLEEIMVRRADRQLYKFKEGDLINLYLNDIEDMLLLVIQHNLFHLDGEVIIDLVVALCMFTRSLIIKKRVKDVQLGVIMERRILRNLEILVGARELEMDYRLMQRTHNMSYLIIYLVNM